MKRIVSTQSVIKSVMLSDTEKGIAYDILCLIDEDDLIILANTVTHSTVLPKTVTESLDCILSYSKSLESLLRRKKVARNVLFKYLYDKKIQIDPDTEKKGLIDKILNVCKSLECQLQVVNSPQVVPECDSNVHHYQSSETISDTQPYSSYPTEVDEMARKFCEWFYSILNEQNPNQYMGVEHFWTDCSLQINFSSHDQNMEQEVISNGEECVKMIQAIKNQHSLYFNPNISNEGIRGRSEPHGLVLVVACGTLHQGESCVGIFEQLFSLARDPYSSNNWKIKFTKLNLKSKDSVTSLPTLTEESLAIDSPARYCQITS